MGWVAAAAAPIIIHLWMRHTHRETPWAAVRFLQAAIQRRARRLKLQEWVLLSIRTLLILLVVFAASKPFLERWGLLGASVRTHRMLVVDASMSMAMENDGVTPLDRARQLAAQLVDKSGSGDVFTLVEMTQSPRATLPSPVADRARVRRMLGAVEQAYGAAKIAEVLPVVKTTLETARAELRGIDRHEVLFFTDLARSSWDLTTAGGQADRLLTALAEEAQVNVVDTGVAGATNAAVTSIELVERLPTAGRPMTVRATLSAFGRGGGATVELLADGLPIAERQATLDPASAVTVEFAHRFDRPGIHTLEARLGSDALPPDDVRGLAIALQRQVSVLCVEGRRDDARLVSRALAPEGAADSAIRVEVVSDAQFDSTKLDRFSAVFFCNVPRFSEPSADRLAGFLQGGGGAAFFLGDLVDPANYRQVLGPIGADGAAPTTGPLSLNGPSLGVATALTSALLQAPATAGRPALLPALVGEAVSDPSYRLDPLDYKHPIAAPFEGRQRAGLLTTPVTRFFQLTPTPGVGEVALGLPSGAPLIVTGGGRGGGRVAVVATDGSLNSIDPATGGPWTAMPAWPSFLPIVRELLFDVAQSEQAAAVLPGQTLSGRLSGDAAGGPQGMDLSVLRPDGTQESIALPAGARQWRYPRTDRLGVYRIAAGDSSQSVGVGIVNADPAESDPQRIAAGSMPAGVNVSRVAASDDAPATIDQPAPVHRGLLYSALGLALLETVLASRWGRGGK
ncbi:hypothetical protein Pla175_09320 [Pirellulimonas nuda]|uniref:VWFA domain-containing protein n=2 Tax=Pirellulimonas nuda TaxID=2528009 RepID=A0A518D7W2_9BACT|nr:hypothetical protein Pla175_09320 [Pirellulimonas nuda]